MKAINNDPAGIYIHVPFCIRKCSYCDFYSLPLTQRHDLDQYTRGLTEEIARQAEGWKDRQFGTVYFGGGTPSLLHPEQVSRILDGLRQHLHLLPQPEISLEANPATLDRSGLRELKNAGINRISLGVQSFRDDELKILGRIHDAGEALQAVEDIFAAGFDNFNLDLIYGIPGQRLADWIYNLEQAVACRPQHISAYLLQLDPSVPLARRIDAGVYQVLNEDQEADMYYAALDDLAGNGFHHYEISNFARPGRECRHNLVYWQADEYLGLGPGAVSFREGRRWKNGEIMAGSDSMYQAGHHIEMLETMDHRGRFVDAMILGLRLTAGISRRQFMERFGIDFTQEYHAIIDEYVGEGLLILDHDRLCLSRRGYFLSNLVMAELL